MTADIAVLRELHRMHRQQADLLSQLDRGPRQVKAAVMQVDVTAVAAADCREAIKKKKMEADRKQLQMRERENRLTDLQGKLNAAKNNREYQAFKEQIAADKQVTNVLSDEILEALEEVDALSVKLTEIDARHQQFEMDRKVTESRVNERADVLNSELARLRAELATTETRLKGDLRATYLRDVASRGEDAMAEVENDSCGGCYNVLSPQLQNQLRMDRPVTCTSCGRILYSSENRAVGHT